MNHILLSATEHSELERHETAIERGLKTFVEVGNALSAIRDARLYRASYATFEEYCQERWNMARQTAYQYIGAAAVVENVRNCGHLPENESQARPLTSLAPEQQPVAWRRAVETAPNGKVTAAHIQSVVGEMRHPAPTSLNDEGDEGEDDWREYVGECDKCYTVHTMQESVLHLPERGVFTCTGCGYSYPPGTEPLEWAPPPAPAALPKVREPKPIPVALPAEKSPRLIVGRAEDMPEVESESVDLIITSPPYNLHEGHWPMGGDGRTPRADGIGYDTHNDAMPEEEYQAWQVQVLIELYRVAKPGASLFYNHKVRNRKGQIIHPMDWLRSAGNPWLIRQEIIWDRGSTHNHNPVLFWPEDERIYWLTKGAPALPDRPLGSSCIWRFHGPVIGTWHPAPFSPELPKRCIEAVGRPGIVVLDPFAGSGTTLKVALEYGYDAIGVDLSAEYLANAKLQNGWQ